MTPYTKVHNPWHDEPVHDTAIDATALNQMESGIAAATTVADTSQTQATALNALVRTGTGSPEGIVTAPIGTLFLRTDGAIGTVLYAKETGTGNTGWVAHGSSGGSSIAKVGTTVAALNAQGPVDGDIGILRIGTWPNVHEEFLKYDGAKWIGDPITVLTQSDTWAMDLGDKKGSDLLLFSLVKNAIPYGKAYTKLNGTQNANAATINALARYTIGPAFTASGTILIRDNIITYTGITGAQSGNFSFTGCTLASGSGGSIPDTVDIVQGFPGGFGMVASALPFAADLWAAGLRLQEKITSFMNGSPEAGGNKALTIAPYWYQYNAGDGYAVPVVPPSGGLGFSASLVGSIDPGAVWTSERPFTWAENPWADWAGAGDAGKVPAKRFLLPRIYGKMPAGSIDTGECLDTTLRVRWISP